MASLTFLTRNESKFIWTKDCKCDFENIEFALTRAPILIFPKLEDPFEVVSEAYIIQA